jgi:hypothetical protein
MGAYEKDFYAWAIEQASLLRAGKLHEIDIENVAEEIESLGKSERRELVNRLVVLLAHLIKWEAQPERRGKSWRLAIEEQRDQVAEHLDENPSLRAELSAFLDRAWRHALREAARETDLDLDAFPAANTWTQEQVLDETFYPE